MCLVSVDLGLDNTFGEARDWDTDVCRRRVVTPKQHRARRVVARLPSSADADHLKFAPACSAATSFTISTCWQVHPEARFARLARQPETL
jgi:hypothetical protein